MSGGEMFAVRELTVSVGKEPHKVFLQDGFYKKGEISDVIHHHKYAEVHLILGGDIIYSVGKSQLRATDGTMLVIPPYTYHSGKMASDTALRAAFQIDAPVAEVSAFSVSAGLLSELFCEIDKAAEGGDHSGVAAYLSVLCRRFVAAEGVCAEPIGDYALLIHEFFSHRYAEEVTLGDLAGSMHLSERQTERLVYKHTGGSFREELTRARIRVAERLIAEGGMSLGEISAYVGYRSYAGFWKAMKKHGSI